MAETQGGKEALRPTIRAFILADEVYIDALTGKKVICGTYNRMWAEEFPSQFARATKCYVCLTDCRGDFALRLQYVDLSNNEVLLESPSVETKGDDPFQPREVIMYVPPLPMPHEGRYSMDVYCGDEMLGSYQVYVAKAEGSSG